MSCKSVMKKWTWVLLVSIVLLFLWTAREGFQDTATLKGPPYNDSDYPTIVNMMPATLVKALETSSGATKPVLPANATAAVTSKYQQDLLAYQRKIVDSRITGVMADFHTSVYQPATAPLTAANVDTFLTTKATSGFLLTNKADIKTLLVAYFVTQPPGDANAALTAAQTRSAGVAGESGYAAILAGLGQAGAPDPKCPSGYTLSADKKTCTGSSRSDTVTPICDTGFTYADGKCAPDSSTSTDSASGGGTTGGSQTFRTSNSGNNKGNIWGPAFSGMGNNAGLGSGAGGARDYPTLLGPKPTPSTMVAGAGIVGPSQHETLGKSGALPGAAGTGSDPNSQFFGSSRVPGDKDLFPNPYREFSASTGSSKTEPIPFLSDFSAFFK